MDDIKIKQVKRGVVVIRGNRHSHFSDMSGAIDCVEFIERGVMPHKKYYQIALQRLLSEEEYAKLRPQKQKCRYVNNKRCV